MKDRSLSFEIDEIPVKVSYNRTVSPHFWDKTVTVFDIEIEQFGESDFLSRFKEEIAEEVICREEYPFHVEIEKPVTY